MYCHDGGSWMIFGGIWMLLLWGAIIAFGVWVVRKLFGSVMSDSVKISENGALDIAKERYAKGEIPREEFEQIVKDLSNKPLT